MCTTKTSSRPISIGTMSGFDDERVRILVERVAAEENQRVADHVQHHVGDEQKAGEADEKLGPD